MHTPCPPRPEALALVHEYTASDSLRKHMLSVEAAMRAYATHFNENEDRWGLCGLLHDFDYEHFPTPPTPLMPNTPPRASACCVPAVTPRT